MPKRRPVIYGILFKRWKMSENWQERTALLLSSEQLDKLRKAHVLVVGLGGVGSYAAEALARSGIGALTIVDGDQVDITNINRQLIALHSTVGQEKTRLFEQRLKDINPQVQITTRSHFFNPEDFEKLLSEQKYDYVIDAIDSVSPKIYLILAAKHTKTKIISAMGAGGKTDPSKIKVTDISKTKEDFLARTIRKRLKKHGIRKGIKCVFSTELQNKASLEYTDNTNYKKSYYGTISYMPALFGLFAAAEVIREIAGLKKD